MTREIETSTVNDFSIYLPSQTLNNYSENLTSDYSILLPSNLSLKGNYECGIKEIIFPKTWYNIHRDYAYLYIRKRTYYYHGTSQLNFDWILVKIESGFYFHPDQLIDEILQKIRLTLTLEGLNPKYYFYSKIRYNKHSNKVILDLAFGESIQFSPVLAGKLGFVSPTHRWNKRETDSVVDAALATCNNPYVKNPEAILSGDQQDPNLWLSALPGDELNCNVITEFEKWEIFEREMEELPHLVFSPSGKIAYEKYLTKKREMGLETKNINITEVLPHNIKDLDFPRFPEENLIVKDYYKIGYAKLNMILKKNIRATNTIDLNLTTHNLYIYSNIVSEMIVGDVYAQLLKIVNTRNGAYGENVFIRYENPDYVKLNSNYIKNIRINIKDSLGENFKFQSGNVLIKLHFRKVQS